MIKSRESGNEKVICGPMMYRPVHGTTDVICRVYEREQGMLFVVRMGWIYPGGFEFYSGQGNPFNEYY